MCKSWCELILAIIIIVFAIVQLTTEATVAIWVILIAGIILLIHSLTCKKCFGEMSMDSMAKPKRRR